MPSKGKLLLKAVSHCNYIGKKSVAAVRPGTRAKIASMYLL